MNMNLDPEDYLRAILEKQEQTNKWLKAIFFCRGNDIGSSLRHQMVLVVFGCNGDINE